MTRPLNEKLALGIFILIVVGLGALIGMVIRPGEWYASLTKPPFNPRKLGVRTGLDDPLHSDRDCGMEDLEGRELVGGTDEDLVRTNDPGLALSAGFLAFTLWRSVL